MKKYYVDSKGQRNILRTTFVRCDITIMLVEYTIEETLAVNSQLIVAILIEATCFGYVN